MHKTYLKLAAIAALIALPFAAHWAFQQMTALPKHVRIATGPAEGRYRVLGNKLAEALEAEYDVSVTLVQTAGSLENINLLQNGDVDFAFYQPGTQAILAKEPVHTTERATFVANVYSEVVHFIVRRGTEISEPNDLIGKRVALGQKNSGDYATSRVLLEHFGLDEMVIEPDYGDYIQIRDSFTADELDAAFITIGPQAPVLAELFATGKCELISLPYARALTLKNVSLSEYEIPAGLYRLQPRPYPSAAVNTVSLRAQFIARENASEPLVAAVTEILLREEFLKQNQLAELFRSGSEFARSKPEFKLHVGARDVYEPGLHPILDSDFVESTEGVRSFIVSILIAAYLAFRWMKDRRAKRHEHRLDRYIRSLLDIEQRQLGLDDESDSTGSETLQKLLDDVTLLRKEALGEFSAHELNEDRATDCFLELCHSLSDKINAKLSRKRLDRKLGELIETVKTTARSADS